jgi:hypothetical protein
LLLSWRFAAIAGDSTCVFCAAKTQKREQHYNDFLIKRILRIGLPPPLSYQQ